MKNLQDSLNENANKIIEQAEEEKAVKENLIFLTDLAMVVEEKND